jgi:hypothetical protein
MRKAFLAISIISLSVMINGCANKNVTVETGAESELTLESSEIVSQSSAEDIKTVAKVMNTTSKGEAIPAAAVSNNTFSDDIHSGYFKIDGDIYKLPMTCQNFMANGWTLVDPAFADMSLAPGDSQGLTLKKGNAELNVTIANIGDIKTSFSNLHVVSLSVNEDTIKNPQVKIELPKGIILSEVGLNDIRSTHGEFDYIGTSTPSGVWDDVFEYKVDEKSEVRFYTDLENRNNIICLYIKSLTELTNKQEQLKQAGPVDIESIVPTPEVSAYQTPIELGTDITSGIIELEGDLYQLPVPASVLERNGWKLSVSFPSEIEPGEYVGVHFSRGDKGFDCLVYNIGRERTSLHNCFIEYLTPTEDDSFKLPDGIQVGSSREDLVNTLQGTNYEFIQEYLSGTDYYLVNKGKTESFVRIFLSNDTNKVEKVSINMSSERKVKPTGPGD